MAWIIIIIIGLGVLAAVIVVLQHFGIIASRYPLKHFDKKEIILERRQGLTKQFTWEDVAAIFPFSFCRFDMRHYHNFAFGIANGENVGFVIVQKDVASLLEKLYDVFLENLNSKEMDVEKVDFSHPTHWIKSKQRFFKMHCILSAFGVLAMGYLGRNFVGWSPYLFPLPFLFLFAIIVIREWLLNRHQKCLLSLKISENQLLWKDEFGRSGTKSLSEVKSFKLDKIKGSLEFSDRTKLIDLEKLYYWPLLREYLLSKL